MRVVAKRYAEALFELARERGQLDRVVEEIELVSQSVQEHDALAAFLRHPRITADEKQQVVSNIFGTQLSDISRNFISLLIERGRQALLPFVSEELTELANESRGVSVGEAVTAIKLSEADLNRLESRFSALVGKKVKLRNKVEPGIQGGVLVRIADRVYDGSVAGKLARFQRRLQETQV